ncbi:MAG: gliding motility lipoprotein GldJ [Chryseobacterium sp.]|nr:MAG: gliding motility lipoprotein GldJ [Chryseobacterium sp.]
MKKLRYLPLLILPLLTTLVGCGGSAGGGGTKKPKSLTGWNPNDQRGWYFTGRQNKGKAWNGMVYVNGGTFTMGAVKDDVVHDWNNVPQRMSVSSFYLSETETTNYDYRAYVTWLKVVFPPNDPEFAQIYRGALPDTLAMNNKLSRNFYGESYFRSPEFDNYPVVGVTWLQANRFCDWLTDRATEKVLIDRGILTRDLYRNGDINYGAKAFTIEKYSSYDEDVKELIDERRFGSATGMRTNNQRVADANRTTTNLGVARFRLPTEAEWEYAALGQNKNRMYNQNLSKAPENESIRITKGSKRGQYLANFKRGRGNYSGLGGWAKDGSPALSDVRQYPANDLGLYGMLGNVSEWTADVYRPTIDADQSDFNYFRGNVIMRIVTNADGSYKRVLSGADVTYDTLADGRLLYRFLPGQLEKEVVQSFADFNDGDSRSALDPRNPGKMYNAPSHRFTVDARGHVILEKDPKMRTSRVADYMRVVKGGSWKDTAYWLDPGQRRYKDQTRAYGWIGFRVAQDARDQPTKRSKR